MNLKYKFLRREEKLNRRPESLRLQVTRAQTTSRRRKYPSQRNQGPKVQKPSLSKDPGSNLDLTAEHPTYPMCGTPTSR